MKLKGYSDYEIFPETGKVWSYKRNKYIGSPNPKGYLIIGLIDNNGKVTNWKLHRLIWTVVNGKIPEGRQVNHINEDKSDNRICNLNLMTPKENNNWGTHNEKLSKALTNHPNKSTPIIAFQNGIIKMWFPSTKEAGRNGFIQPHIVDCCNGKRKTHKNHQWEYQDVFLADWWEQEMEKGA